MKQSLRTTKTKTRLKTRIQTRGAKITLLKPPAPECPICGDEMVKGRTVKTASCGHTFHKECMLTWCNNRKGAGVAPTCPLCRESKNFTKTCASIQPGHAMPDHHIVKLLHQFDIDSYTAGTFDPSGQRRQQMKTKLETLRFKRNLGEEWQKIVTLRQALEHPLLLR